MFAWIVSLLIIISSPVTLSGQFSQEYLIITIERKQSWGIHRQSTDYWLLSTKEYYGQDDNYLVPLYFYGFSDQDMLECQKGNLVFFNLRPEESYDTLRKQEEVFHEVQTKRKQISKTVNRKSSGRVVTKVYLTRVSGTFLYCGYSDLSIGPIGFCDGIVALPREIEVRKYDATAVGRIVENSFYLLPGYQLHKVQ